MPSKTKRKTKKPTTGNLPSVNAAIAVLTLAMQDPLHEQVCAFRLSVASHRIDQELENFQNFAEKSKFVRSYPEFLRAGIRFLTTSYESVPELDAFIDKMGKCSHGCPSTRHRIYRESGIIVPLRASSSTTSPQIRRHRCSAVPAEELVEDIFQIFDALNIASTFIEISLSELTRHKFRAFNAEDAVQNWPQGPDDLLPFGPKQSVEALANWARNPPLGSDLFRLIGSLALFYAPFSKVIVGSAIPHELSLPIPASYLRHIIEDYDTLSDKSPRRPVPLEAVHDHFKTVLDSLSNYYENIQRSENGLFPSVMKGFGRSYHLTFSKVVEILNSPSLSSPDFDRSRLIMSRMATYTLPFSEQGNPLGIFGGASRIRDAINAERMEPAFEPLRTRRKAGCANLECPIGLESVVHAKLCGKCDLVRFCDKKCLRQAWNSRRHPHKELCESISEFRISLGPEAWTSMWAHGFTERDFEDLCRGKGVSIDQVKNDVSVPLRMLAMFADFEHHAQAIRNLEFGKTANGAKANAHMDKLRKQLDRVMDESNANLLEELMEGLEVG